MIETGPEIHIVDDDESVRNALERLIRSAGFRVRTFVSAEDFLQNREHAVPGCLLLDVRMPGRSGLELQDELAASGVNVPIVFITAHDDDEARSRALRGGAVAFFQKPFEDQALLDVIHKALTGHGQNQRHGTV